MEMRRGISFFVFKQSIALMVLILVPNAWEEVFITGN